MAARPPKEVTADNERKAWELRRKCWTQERIARELGIERSTVAKMLQRRDKVLAREFKDRAEGIKAQQAEQLEYITEEAMDGWERSKLDAEMERTVAKRLGAKPGAKPEEKPGQSRSRDSGGAEVPGMYLNPETGEEVDAETAAEMIADAARKAAEGSGLTMVEETTTKEARGQAGDPRFLDQARGAMADIRTIWGLDAPKKNELTGKDGRPLEVDAPTLREAAKELDEWRKQMTDQLSNMPSASPMSPISPTPTE